MSLLSFSAEASTGASELSAGVSAFSTGVSPSTFASSVTSVSGATSVVSSAFSSFASTASSVKSAASVASSSAFLVSETLSFFSTKSSICLLTAVLSFGFQHAITIIAIRQRTAIPRNISDFQLFFTKSINVTLLAFPFGESGSEAKRIRDDRGHFKDKNLSKFM